MEKRFSKITKIIIAAIFASIVSAWVFLWFYPFGRFDMIATTYSDTTDPDNLTTAGKIHAFIDRAKKYPEVMHLTKGMTFKNIPSKYGNVDIRLRWDNNISLKCKGKEIIFYVNCIAPVGGNIVNLDSLQAIYGSHYLPCCEDDYTGVYFTDIKNNVVCIDRQPDGMPFGDKEYGFCVSIDGIKFDTEKNFNPFDY